MISKNRMYYAEHNNTIYYLIASYLLWKPTDNITSLEMQQNQMKSIKVQNRSGTKLIN